MTAARRGALVIAAVIMVGLAVGGVVLVHALRSSPATTSATNRQPLAGARTTAPRHPKSATSTPPVTPAAKRPLIAGAIWTHTTLGFRILVHPTAYGRAHALLDPPLALREAVERARPTPISINGSVRRSLTNQLRCHADFVPDKPDWDLESWRPDVGYNRTVLALCNP